MQNTLATSEIKRRGMAAIEDALKRGPVHLTKRNKPTAVILSEAEYQALVGNRSAVKGMSAKQWLQSQSAMNNRSKADIDAQINEERGW